MLTELFFYLLIAILCFGFAIELLLSLINASALKERIPSQLKPFYPEKKYTKSVHYFRKQLRLSLFEQIFSFLLIIITLKYGLFGYLELWSTHLTANNYLVTLLFFGVLGFAITLLNLPFDLYRTFSLEAQFGFNKTTLKRFFGDTLKQSLLLVIIGGGLLLFTVWVWQISGHYFWILLWAAVSLFSLLITFLYSSLIVPLFNKQVPLEVGELRTEIAAFAQKAGFTLDNIFVIDGSKRSTKANAYFTGFGKKKRIVLYDTLIEKFETPEIVAVLAHEIGHYKKKHVVKGMISMLIQNALLFFILSLFIREDSLISTTLSQAVAGNNETLGFSLQLGIIGFAIIYNPIALILGVVQNVFSRKHEYQADAFAAKYGLQKPLANALLKLSVDSLSNMTPHPWYMFFNYSHPPVLERVKKLEEFESTQL